MSDDFAYLPNGCLFDEARKVKHEPDLHFVLFIDLPRGLVVPSTKEQQKPKLKITNLRPKLSDINEQITFGIKCDRKNLQMFDEVAICSRCSKIYANERMLIKHRRSFHSEKKFVCNYCGQSYACESGLRRHLDYEKHINDSNPQTHKCNQCTKSYRLHENLQRHINVHKTEAKNHVT